MLAARYAHLTNRLKRHYRFDYPDPEDPDEHIESGKDLKTHKTLNDACLFYFYAVGRALKIEFMDGGGSMGLSIINGVGRMQVPMENGGTHFTSEQEWKQTFVKRELGDDLEK